jgi:hypothetical protein
MSKLMIILGIIAAAAGAVIGTLIYVSPGQMQVLGLTPEVAATMLVGGLGLIGFGGVIAALDKVAGATQGLRAWLSGQDNGQTIASATATTVSEFTPVTATPPSFPVPTPVVETQTSVSKIDALIEESKHETNRAVAKSRETIAAIDKANSEIKEALGVPEPEATPPPAAPEPAAEDAEAEAEDTQLFVVEERLIRGRPARVLSDGTVEAETDDGWMRFENLEHLEEYLDAMSPGQP